MKNEEIKTMLPLNLQFFAEDDGGNGNGNEDQTLEKENSGEKTFTQSQVSTMMAKEKNEGRRSILKLLGFSNEEEAKSAIAAYNAFVNSQKDDKEKNADDVKKANEEKSASEARAIAAENKLVCFENGVNKEYIDDVLAIAALKISDEKDLEHVLKDMKKDNKYSSFFTSGKESSNGTGVNPGHQGGRSSDKQGELGKRLGSVSNTGKEQKSSFF
ncbi:MAG: hypothetical protein J6T10_22655 [Methanobrevibacter sp.]|nr:hypothetical protein [Methanobrevibacter sp.]